MTGTVSGSHLTVIHINAKKAVASGCERLDILTFRRLDPAQATQHEQSCQPLAPRATATGVVNPLFGYKAYARDPQSAERLWQISEKLVGLKG